MGMTAVAPAAVATAMAPAAAHAATDGPAQHGTAQSGKIITPAVTKWAGIVHPPAPFYLPNNNEDGTFTTGQSVHVTCYYTGAPYASDPYWDHITGMRSKGVSYSFFTGHVADYHVNLGGRFPSSVGIPHC
ncbi:MAG TPA: hypothetical protein VGG35_06895 [Streptosporangiaceae bacterium]